jgi:hypothetical protein
VVVSTAITVAVLVVVFAGIFPKVADYSQAWSSIQRMASALNCWTSRPLGWRRQV